MTAEDYVAYVVSSIDPYAHTCLDPLFLKLTKVEQEIVSLMFDGYGLQNMVKLGEEGAKERVFELLRRVCRHCEGTDLSWAWRNRIIDVQLELLCGSCGKLNAVKPIGWMVDRLNVEQKGLRDE